MPIFYMLQSLAVLDGEPDLTAAMASGRGLLPTNGRSNRVNEVVQRAVLEMVESP